MTALEVASSWFLVLPFLAKLNFARPNYSD
jgi:hypothetical protein